MAKRRNLKQLLDAQDAAAARDGFRVTVSLFEDVTVMAPYVAEYRTQLGDWIVNGSLQIIDGQLAIGSLNVGLSADVVDARRRRRPRRLDERSPAGVTTSLLRSIPLLKILDQARLALTAWPEFELAKWLTGDEEARVRNLQGARAVRETLEELTAAPTKRGRPGFDDTFYEQIARQYLDLQARHGARGLLDRLGDAQAPPCQRETVRDWVRRATQLGYLSPATPGRAGRSAGARLTTENQ